MNLVELIGTNQVDNSVELYYICLLGKYVKSHNGFLSLHGVDLSKLEDTLECSTYYDFIRYSIENGFIVDFPLDLTVYDEEESTLHKMFFMKDFSKEKPYFYQATSDKLYINMRDTGGNYINLSMFSESIEESAVIDLTAYLQVNYYYTKDYFELYPTVSNTLRGSSLGVSSLFYLSNSKITKGILKFEVMSSAERVSLTYSSWYLLGKEQGLLSDEGYSVLDKLERMEERGYKVGSIVQLNERGSTSKSRKDSKLKTSTLAIIREMRGTDVILERVPTIHTRLSKKKSFSSKSMSVQALYSHAYFEINTFRETYNLTSLGIDYYMSDDLDEFERVFLTHLPKDNKIELWVEQSGFEFKALMSVVDAVFWIFKDWGIDFDEELYIKANYKDREIPLFYKDLVSDFGFDGDVEFDSEYDDDDY